MNSNSVCEIWTLHTYCQIPRGCVLCLQKGMWHFFSNFDVYFSSHKGDDRSNQVFTSLAGELDFIFSYFVPAAKLYLQWYSPPKMALTGISSAKQEAQLKQGLADRTAKTAVSAAI